MYFVVHQRVSHNGVDHLGGFFPSALKTIMGIPYLLLLLSEFAKVNAISLSAPVPACGWGAQIPLRPGQPAYFRLRPNIKCDAISTRARKAAAASGALALSCY